MSDSEKQPVKKIESLTPEQEAAIPQYVKKWIAIGLSTGDCDVPKAIKGVKLAYAEAKLEPPKFFFLANSPAHGAAMDVAIKAHLEAGGTFEPGPDGLCKIEIPEPKDKADHSNKIREAISAQIYGAHDASWLSFYDFFGTECKIDVCECLRGLMIIAESCGWWTPRETYAVLQHKPDHIHMTEVNGRGVLHCPTGAAIRYRDGFSVWALNGARVPSWLVETPAEQLDPRKFQELVNAQQRAEFVRKFGIDRLCHEFGAKVIHQDGTYELVELAIDDQPPRRYLKMINPSVGVFHVEGVPNNIETVQGAIEYRMSTALAGRQVSPDGEDWYQQGDVMLIPTGAKVLKPRPIVLT